MLCACECVCEERRDVFERREWQRREERAMRSGASGCVVKRRRIAEM